MKEFFTNLKSKFTENRKINVISVFFFAFFAVLIVRLWKVQIIDNEKYEIRAKKQVTKREVVKPPRGIIFDRNMNQLVTNLYEYTIDVYPKYVKNPDSVAAVLADLFKKDKNHYS